MSSRLLATAAVVMSLVGVASPSAATVTLASATIVTGPYVAPPVTFDFDTALTTPTYTGGAIVSGSSSGQYAAPVGGTANYFTVGGTGAASPAVISLVGFGSISTISLLLGSVDSYNTISFGTLMGSTFTSVASFTGTQIYNLANGNQGISSLATFTFSGADQLINAMQVTSTNPAAEFDNITITSAVPEPGTWAMMLLGFAGVGYSMRRRPANRRRMQAI